MLYLKPHEYVFQKILGVKTLFMISQDVHVPSMPCINLCTSVLFSTRKPDKRNEIYLASLVLNLIFEDMEYVLSREQIHKYVYLLNI